MADDQRDERTPFEPSKHLRQLKGRGGGPPQPYLDVKWRLVWFRDRYPQGHVETELVDISADRAVFKAVVRNVDADGNLLGIATGFGSETAGDFGDFIEKAETKAVGRALAVLGYGIQFAELGDDPDPPTGAPKKMTLEESNAYEYRIHEAGDEGVLRTIAADIKVAGYVRGSNLDRVRHIYDNKLNTLRDEATLS